MHVAFWVYQSMRTLAVAACPSLPHSHDHNPHQAKEEELAEARAALEARQAEFEASATREIQEREGLLQEWQSRLQAEQRELETEARDVRAAAAAREESVLERERASLANTRELEERVEEAEARDRKAARVGCGGWRWCEGSLGRAAECPGGCQLDSLHPLSGGGSCRSANDFRQCKPSQAQIQLGPTTL